MKYYFCLWEGFAKCNRFLVTILIIIITNIIKYNYDMLTKMLSEINRQNKKVTFSHLMFHLFNFLVPIRKTCTVLKAKSSANNSWLKWGMSY